MCTSAHYGTEGLPVFHVNCFLSFWRITLHVVWALKEWRGAKSLSGGFDGLVTRFLHFSGNTDVLLRDEDSTDTRIEQLEKDGRGFTFQKIVTVGYLNNDSRLCIYVWHFFLFCIKHISHGCILMCKGGSTSPQRAVLYPVRSESPTCVVPGKINRDAFNHQTMNKTNQLLIQHCHHSPSCKTFWLLIGTDVNTTVTSLLLC